MFYITPQKLTINLLTSLADFIENNNPFMYNLGHDAFMWCIFSPTNITICEKTLMQMPIQNPNFFKEDVNTFKELEN
jgi:hypothetical protein